MVVATFILDKPFWSDRCRSLEQAIPGRVDLNLSFQLTWIRDRREHDQIRTELLNFDIANAIYVLQLVDHRVSAMGRAIVHNFLSEHRANSWKVGQFRNGSRVDIDDILWNTLVDLIYVYQSTTYHEMHKQICKDEEHRQREKQGDDQCVAWTQ